MEKTKRGLAPVIGDAPEVLILGSIPGDISIQKQQYYASPRNQFWQILSGVFDSPVGSTYADRVEFVLTHKLALWDVLKSADREGSLDSSIRKAAQRLRRVLLGLFRDFYYRSEWGRGE